MIVQFLSGSSVCQPHLLRWSQMIWASELDAMISLQKNMEAGSDSASAITRLDSRHTACTGDVTYCEGLPFCILCRSLKYCYLREPCNITTVILMLMWCFFHFKSINWYARCRQFHLYERRECTFPLSYQRHEHGWQYILGNLSAKCHDWSESSTPMIHAAIHLNTLYSALAPVTQISRVGRYLLSSSHPVNDPVGSIMTSPYREEFCAEIALLTQCMSDSDKCIYQLCSSAHFSRLC